MRGFVTEGQEEEVGERRTLFEHTTATYYNHSDAFFQIEAEEILPTPAPTKQTL